jgi:hypothetical protein
VQPIVAAAGTTITGANANDTSPADRDFAGPSRNRTAGGAIKGLFREVIKAITRRANDDPAPARRRPRGGTGRAFCRVAKAALRRIPWFLPEAFATPTFLADTIDWLNYWQNDAGSSDSCDNLDANRNDLSPRL